MICTQAVSQLLSECGMCVCVCLILMLSFGHHAIQIMERILKAHSDFESHNLMQLDFYCTLQMMIKCALLLQSEICNFIR